jgi:sialidase-1
MRIVGDVVLELPPNEGNPRNSEGAFIQLNNDKILFVYSKYIGDSYADYATAAIASYYSKDNGNTWSESKTIAKPDEYKAKNLMSVSLMRMQNGDIGLFYLIRYGWHDMRLHLRRSSDEGDNWGEPIPCISTPVPGYYVTNNDRVIRTSYGRLIVATSHHNMINGRVVHYFLSDDDGKTWRVSRSNCALNCSNSKSGLQEPGVIELANGVVWSWARTDLGRQYEMFSRDMGETWTSPTPSVFTSPCSPLSMKRIPKNNYLLAVWNPIPNYQTRVLKGVSNGRTPLIGAISKDEGNKWGNYFYIEDDEESGYCYTSIYSKNDIILLAYCAGGIKDGICLSRLRIKRILLSDIL